ncbi:unnamed protein product [Dicrocoelium dendriticum]|nr:unnamed protein product [Dicrocoelium dendriticum]
MAPRTQHLQDQRKLSSGSNTASLTLVLEDFELFEAETAELTIEEADDFAASLLLSNDGTAPVSNTTVASGPDLNTLITRDCHTLIHSAHSLATTSVVVPTQHAQTIEYKMLTMTSQNMPTDSYFKTIIPVSHCNGARFSSNPMDDWAHTLPAHILTVSSQSAFHRPLSSWPQHILAFTDAPALVRAVAADLESYSTHVLRNGSTESPSIVQVAPCDRTSEWTTCQLTCCQAEVELLEVNAPHQQAFAVISDAPTNEFHVSRSIPLLSSPQRLQLPADIAIRICPFTGIRPQYFGLHNSMTAVYLILVDESTAFNRPTAFLHQLGEHPLLLAMLVSLVPTSTSISGGQLDRIRIDHQLVRSRLVGCSSQFPDLRFCAFVALVDILTDSSSSGYTHLNCILHQRLHYLPGLVLHLGRSD